jgi:L-lysine 2,3-aminomutase
MQNQMVSVVETMLHQGCQLRTQAAMLKKMEETVSVNNELLHTLVAMLLSGDQITKALLATDCADYMAHLLDLASRSTEVYYISS